MIVPPTDEYRILIYGKDSTLLETRRLLLVSSGFHVYTVSSLQQFRTLVDRERRHYELFILCHTIPEEERTRIQGMAIRRGAGLYQLERMEEPPRFIGKVTHMSARVEDGDMSKKYEFSESN
jgi:hypothetical protein